MGPETRPLRGFHEKEGRQRRVRGERTLRETEGRVRETLVDKVVGLRRREDTRTT